MEHRLRQAIARVEVVNGTRVVSGGTGVLVAPGLVVTALHVVADRASDPPHFHPGQITLTFPGHTTDAERVDGMWDRHSDWIMLRCAAPPDARPMPLADAPPDGAPWETYGFPDANPRDGMALTGTLENQRGDLDGAWAFQLFSKQAAAGTGAPVSGLSGAPVIVDGALVAILRFALMNRGATVAGTLYGCPVGAVVARAGDRLPLPDPCRGLPGLRHRPLPANPFKYLNRYTAAEAEIFFGRNREIRRLYELLTRDDAAQIVTLYGQTGAGKSSLLDAGVLPRLEWTHDVRYLRRDRAETLLDTVRRAVASDADRGRPLIVIVDQVEEVYTEARSDAGELDALLSAFKAQLSAGGVLKRARLVLSFRKEWLPEIHKALENSALDHANVFLEGLDRPAIVEVVTGLTSTRRLRDRYGLRVADGLAELIASDLSEDRESAIAPTLQILLSKLWQLATAENRSAPAFTMELYQQCKRQGVLLGDFLDQQLAGLAEGHPATVASGLAIDVLNFHTTPLLAAQQRSAEQMRLRYQHRATDLAALLEEMQRRFLLVDASGDREANAKTTRLSHDTLAPLVRQRFDESDRPGQRAHRIVESRVVEWKQGRTGTPLDPADLKVVERGLEGMRALDADDERLLQASIESRQAAERHNRLLKAAGAVALAAILVFAVAAAILRQQAESERRFAISAARTIQAREALETDPTLAALLLAELRGYPATADSVRTANLIITEPLALAVLKADDGPITLVTVSPDGQSVLAGSNDGTARIWRLGAAAAPLTLDPSTCPSKSGQSPIMVGADYDPSGSRVVTYSVDATVRLWSRDGNCLRSLPHDNTVRSAAFNREGTLLVTVTARGNRALIWPTDGATDTPAYELPHDEPVTSAAFGAASSQGPRVLTLAGGVLRIWTLEGSRSPVASRVPLPSDVTMASFDADGRYIAVATRSGAVRVISTEAPTARPLEVESSPERSSIQEIKFCPGARCVGVLRDAEVEVIDVTGSRVRFQHPGEVYDFVFSQDGGTLATAADDQRVRVWVRTKDGWSGPTMLRSHYTGGTASLAFIDNGKNLVTGSSDGTVRVWRTASHEPLEIADLQADVDEGAFDPEGRHAVVLSEDGMLSAWRIEEKGAQKGSAPTRVTDAASYRVDISATGSHVLGLSKGSLRVWRVAGDAGAQLVALNEFDQTKVVAASFSRDGSHVFTSNEANIVRRSSLVEKAAVVATTAFTLPVLVPILSMSFNADGTRAVTGHFNGAFVWRLPAGPDNRIQREVQLQPYGDTPIFVTFNRDESRVLMLDAQSIARVFSADATGTPIELTKTPLRAVTFADSGSHILGLAADGRMLRWRLDWEELIDALDQATAACLSTEQRTQYLGENTQQARRAAEACAGRKRDRRLVSQ